MLGVLKAHATRGVCFVCSLNTVRSTQLPVGQGNNRPWLRSTEYTRTTFRPYSIKPGGFDYPRDDLASPRLPQVDAVPEPPPAAAAKGKGKKKGMTLSINEFITSDDPEPPLSLRPQGAPSASRPFIGDPARPFMNGDFWHGPMHGPPMHGPPMHGPPMHGPVPVVHRQPQEEFPVGSPSHLGGRNMETLASYWPLLDWGLSSPTLVRKVKKVQL